MDEARPGGEPRRAADLKGFHRNLKAYAREAGLTYARIVAEEPGSLIEAQEALDHENQATTRVYVQRITVKCDRHGARVAGRMKLDDRGEGKP